MAERRRLSPFVFLPPVVFLALAAVFYVGMAREDPDALPSTRVGGPAPATTVTAFEGAALLDDTLLTQPGVKLVNFWASWCAPCRVEHPNLEALATEGITIYGVNYKDDPVKAARFLDELGNPYAAIGTDGQGRTALDWGVYGVPETFVIDGRGQVTLRFAGPITEAILAHTIRPAIQEAAAK